MRAAPARIGPCKSFETANLMKGWLLKGVKTGIAVLLLPLCWGLSVALTRVVNAGLGNDVFWVGFLSGAACWLVVFLMLPKPMWVYVMGHELTHVLWTWLFGGRVKRFKATSRGGQVTITRTNFLIALAPYFFPFFTMLVAAGWALGSMVWDLRPYQVVLHLLLGATFAFHVTLTFCVLSGPQSDLAEHGYFFSAVVIFLGNLTIGTVGLAWLTERVPVSVALDWVWKSTWSIWRYIFTIK
jgi:hypothetical protein